MTKPIENRFTCSMLDAFSLCRRKCYWQYKRRLVPVRRNWNMMGGTIVHAGFEAWFRTFDEPEALKAITKAAADASKGAFMTVEDEFERDKYAAMAVGFIRAHAAQYPADAKWHVLAVEAAFELVRINGFFFDGIADLIAADARGSLFVMDHKTRSRV